MQGAFRGAWSLAGAALTAALLALPGAAPAEPIPQGPANVPGFSPAFPGQTRAGAIDSGIALETSILTPGLEHPWGLAILPGGAGYLVTERPGRLRLISPDGTLSAPLGGLPEITARQQGGLLDVALAEDFATSRQVLLTYSKPVSGGSVTALYAARLSEDGSRLEAGRDLFLQQPASLVPMHYGARVLARDGMIWITPGERSIPENRVLAQDPGISYGKVIRLTAAGAAPRDNPFVTTPGALPEVWSLGHRNPQGAAFDAAGQLWLVEHGPRGGDELNLIRPGLNYGWPVISYGQNYDRSSVGSGASAAPGMEQPVYYWDPVIAPGDMVFYDGEMFPEWQGSLVIASLNPGGLNRLELEDGTVSGEEKLLPRLGRVRDVDVDTDGSLLVLTDAPDGALIRLTRR